MSRNCRSFWFFACSILPFTSSAALACQFSSPLRAEQISSADVVVIGKVTNYHIVRDEDSRARRREDCRKAKSFSSKRWAEEGWKALCAQKDFISDYAQFTIIISDVLKGRAPRSITATWDASTFSEPNTFPSDLRLIGLRKPDVAGGRLASNPMYKQRSRFYFVMQVPCSGAFIIPANSDFAQEVKSFL